MNTVQEITTCDDVNTYIRAHSGGAATLLEHIYANDPHIYKRVSVDVFNLLCAHGYAAGSTDPAGHDIPADLLYVPYYLNSLGKTPQDVYRSMPPSQVIGKYRLSCPQAIGKILYLRIAQRKVAQSPYDAAGRAIVPDYIRISADRYLYDEDLASWRRAGAHEIGVLRGD